MTQHHAKSTACEMAIDTLRTVVGDATRGLPEDVFLFATCITPMVNVDLLIRDAQNRVLLTWRQDRHHGQGWHVPGGIIRLRERIADRLAAVAKLELGAQVSAGTTPVAVHEFIDQSAIERSHFISFLYACQFVTPPDEVMRHRGGNPQVGVWQWFDRCPDDLLPVQEIYRAHIDGCHLTK